MVKENKAKRKLASGGATCSIGITFCHGGLAEYLGAVGFDIIMLDTSTQAVTETDVEDFARACEVTGVVSMVNCRPDAPLIRYASSGVQAFNLKNVESLDEVHAVISATKFPPQGKRITGAWRSNDFGASTGDWATYMERANSNMMIMVTVEDIAAMELVPAIVKIPDVDIVQIAFNDLTMSMGLSGQKRHPKVTEAFEKARATILAAGKTNSMAHLVDTPEEIKDEYQRGTRNFSTNTRRALLNGSKWLLDTVHGFK